MDKNFFDPKEAYLNSLSNLTLYIIAPALVVIALSMLHTIGFNNGATDILITVFKYILVLSSTVFLIVFIKELLTDLFAR